jgi:hypothetical protein
MNNYKHKFTSAMFHDKNKAFIYQTKLLISNRPFKIVTFADPTVCFRDLAKLNLLMVIQF